MNRDELKAQIEAAADLSSFPICKNCKFFIEEKVGAHQVKDVCGLTAIEPVTGNPAMRPKPAAQMRRDTMPCGVGGKFFEKKVEKKPNKEKVQALAPEAQTVKVDVPKVEPEAPKAEAAPKEAPKRRRGRPKAE